MKKEIGHYKPMRVRRGVNETTLPLKEGELFWSIYLGDGCTFDTERQKDAEIISRLARIEKKMDTLTK